MTNTNHYPPPWNLNGEGFIIPFLGSKSDLIQKGFIAEEDKESFRGGLGACMLVNYSSSNVGPYFELLFIPGDFEYSSPTNKRNLFKKITKIFVSSEDSIREGIRNWAIPKEYANFTWTKKKKSTNIIVRSKEKNLILDAEFTKKFISFPVSTKLYPVSLLQKSENSKQFINTEFQGSGMAKFASLNKWEVDEKYFVNLSAISRIKFNLSIDKFNIIFPLPRVF